MTGTEFRKNHGNRLLQGRFKGSHYRLLRQVYPEHDWLPWKFKFLPRNMIGDPEAVKRAIAFVEKERNLLRPEDWYGISTPILRSLGVFRIVEEAGGLYRFLKTYRPDFAWEEDRFVGVRLFGDKYLGALLRKLWPNLSVLEAFELAPGLTVSYYIAELRLAVDYQNGSYYNLDEAGGTVSVELRENPAKLSEAAKQGLQVLFVPFWWDRTLPSLIQSVLMKFPHFASSMRSDIVAEEFLRTAKPIPTATTIQLSYWRKKTIPASTPSKRTQTSPFSKSPRRIGPPRVKEPKKPPKWERKPFTLDQLSVLERSFEIDPRPGSLHIADIAAQIHTSAERVRIWFQDERRRAKAKERDNLRSVIV